MRKKLFSILALLCLTVAGAWAQTIVMLRTNFPSDESTTFNESTWKWAQKWTTITTDYVDFAVKQGTFSQDDFTPTIAQIINGLKVSNLQVCGSEGKVSTVQLLDASGNVVKTETCNKALVYDDNRISISNEFFANVAENYTIRVNLSECSFVLPKTEGKNEWTLDKMPANNVELQVAYFPGMLTLASGGNGTLALSYEGETLPTGFDTDGTNIYVESGKEFKVKGVPTTEGYHMVSLSDGTNTYDIDADGLATVTMPAEYADLTLTATFSDQYELTFDDRTYGTNANITVSVGDEQKTLDENGKLSVKAGQTVTLTAKQGYKFRDVSVKKAGAATFLGAALVNGATLEVTLHPGDNDDMLLGGNFTYNDGTFTLNNILGRGFDSQFATATVDGTTITFNAGFFNQYYNHTTTFNTANDTYETTGGAYHGSLSSVKVNGEEILDKLTKVE
jgi:hypothetical protein